MNSPPSSPLNRVLCVCLALGLAVIPSAFSFAAILEPGIAVYLQGGASGPQLTLEDVPRYDFGDAFAGEDMSHTFVVRNTGTAPLELSQAPLLLTPSKVSFSPSPGKATEKPSIASFQSSRSIPAMSYGHSQLSFSAAAVRRIAPT